MNKKEYKKLRVGDKVAPIGWVKRPGDEAIVIKLTDRFWPSPMQIRFTSDGQERWLSHRCLEVLDKGE
jgi:hypothetical protein